MTTERRLIERMLEYFPRHPAQVNAPFTADAELVCIEGRTWAVTTDEFSSEEDGFTTDDPARLGWNLAVATLSDLLAVGAAPRFFLDALVLPRDDADAFGDGVAAGVSSVLAEAGCAFLGGDLGMGDAWRFTGVAFGPAQAAGGPLTRVFGGVDVELWSTGAFGDANVALFTGAPTPVFEFRAKAAEIAARHGRGCIDTSGGLFEALHTLAQVNPGARIEVDFKAVPLADSARSVAVAAGVPVAAALIGGAGEYELVFGLPRAADESVRCELRGLGATIIGGAFHDAGPAGVFVRARGATRPVPVCPDPRSFVEREAYLAAVFEAGAELEGRC